MIPPVLLIPLGTGSTWSNNELRYALRSWQAFGNITEVLIIGHKPPWYTGSHLRYDTPHCKTEDIFRKTQYAASVYDQFIFANDDHILLQPLTELPYYHQGLISDFKGGSETFMRYVMNTERICPGGKYFDVHTPMIVDSKRMAGLKYTKDTLFKSVYCYGMEGVQVTDCKINQHLRTDEIEARLTDKKMFSFGDCGLSNDMKKWLSNKFPVPSRWELA